MNVISMEGLAMIISLAELLEREKIKREDTIYANSNEEFLEYQVVAGDFYTWEKDTESIWFKNCVQLADFAYMEKMIPKLSCLNCPDRDKLPYFVSDLEDLKEAVSKGRQIGIEGGPCLFGAYEVMTEVVLEQGESVWFDYSTGNRVDAVKDYISMPALPYYRWGITDVLEMNSQEV